MKHPHPKHHSPCAILRENTDSRTRLAVLSFYDAHCPHFIEVLILVVEYLQLFAQIALQASQVLEAYDTPTLDSAQLLTVLFSCLRIFDIGQFVDFTKETDTDIIVIFFSFCLLYFVSLFSLAIYIGFAVKKEFEPRRNVLMFWRWIVRLHGPIIFYVIASFCFCLLRTARQDLLTFAFGKEAFYISASLILLVFCLAFSLAIWIRNSQILPSKSFNSCKSHTPEIITVCQKFALGTLFIFLPDNSFTSFWVLAIISILFSLLRSATYFNTLPNFNIRAMYFKGYLINTETALNLVILLRGFIISFSVKKLGTLFTVGTTLVLIPFIVRFTSSFLTNTIIELLTSPCKKMNPEKLLHKVMIVKQVRQRMKSFNKFSKDSDLYYFLYTVLSNNIRAVFQLNEEEGPTYALEPNTSVYKVIIIFLTNLAKKHPHNDLIKLYLAYFHGKKMKTYCTALQIIRDITYNSRSSKLVLNAMLITYEIQKIVKAECLRNTEPLDILEYIQNLERVNSVEQKIQNQGELQGSLCQEYKHQEPNVALINRKAQTIEQLRQKIRKNMARFVSHCPEYNIEPLLMFASYELILNYNAKEYLHFLKMYFNKYSKYLYKYRSHDLNQENLFHHDRIFLIISAQKDNSGIVQYASKSTKNVLGWDSKLIIGTGFTQLLPVPAQKHYNLLVKNVMENSDQNYLGRVEKAFIYHKDGYIKHVDQFIQVHPYVNNGLFLNMIFRPVQESSEYLLISKDGNIEAYTQGIGRKLGLTLIHETKLNISTLCKEFASVNYAFNLMSTASEGLKMMKTTTATKVRPVVKLSVIGKLKSSFRKALMRKNHLANDAPLNAEEARAIFDKLTTVGKTYFLEKTSAAVNEHSLKSVGTGGGSRVFTTRQTTRFGPVAFHCHVSNWIGGTNPLKVWTLTEAEIDPMTGEPASGTSPTRMATGKFNQEEKIPSNTTIYTPELKKGKASAKKRMGSMMQKINFRWDKDIDPTQIPEDGEPPGEEKEGGWLDVEKLLSSERQELVLGSRKSSELRSSDKRYSTSRFGAENPDSLTKKLEEIIDPVQMASPGFKRVRKGILPGTIMSDTSRNLSFRKHGMQHFDMIKKSHFGAQEDEEEEESQDLGDRDFGEEPSHSMHQSQHGAVDHKASKSIRDSLDMKYYPKSFWIFVVLFYLMIAMTFSVQVLLEHKFSTYLEDISHQKDVFKDSASRTETIILTERHYRMLLVAKLTAVTPEDIANLTAETTMALPLLKQLADVNQNLTLTMDFLSDEQREEVDRADVKIYDTYYSDSPQVYMELESYQATGRVAEMGYRLVAQMNSSLMTVLPMFRFIFRNSLNDLLLKSQSITRVLLGSLTNTRNTILITTKVTLMVSLFFLLCCLTAGLIIIFRTFKSMNQKMKAFIKLNDNTVSEVHGKIDTYMRILRSGEYIEFLEESFAGSATKSAAKPLEAVKHRSHSSISKEANNRGLKKQYYIHAVNFSIMLVCLIVIIVVNFILLDQNLWLCQSSLDQISFTNDLKEAVMLSATATLELYAENGTTYMRDNPILDEVFTLNTQVEQIRTQMARTYINNDNQNYDPIIELILFKDGCQVFTPAEQLFCQAVRAGVNDVSLLSLLSTMESSLDSLYEQFIELGGSSPASLYGLVSTFYPIVGTIEALNKHLGDRIDENFDDLTEQVSSQSTVTFGLVYPATAVLCLFIWFTVLRLLSETDNKFKNVLKLLPPSLVTTNFVLKSFIMRTSTGLITSAFSES